MPSPASPARTAGLAAAGFVLVALAYVPFAMGVFSAGVGRQIGTAAGWALVVAGIACGVAALRQSLRRWQMTGRAPVVALLYAGLGVAALGWWASGPSREAAFYRANPGVMSAELAGDGIDVRDARGRWHVAFSECPDASGATETRSQTGTVDVIGAAGRPAMRLHVRARRVECLP